MIPVGTPLPPNKTRCKLMAELQRRSALAGMVVGNGTAQAFPPVQMDPTTAGINVNNNNNAVKASAPPIQDRTVKLSQLSHLLEMSALARDGTSLSHQQWHAFLNKWVAAIEKK